MKMKVFAVILIAVLFCTCALEGVNVIGPAGGFVFYDKGNYSDGWRYLECSPINAGQVDNQPYDFARIQKICDDFVYNGYDDWRLPNDNELYTMLKVFPRQLEFTEHDFSHFYISSEGNAYEHDGDNWGNLFSPSSQKTLVARPVRQF